MSFKPSGFMSASLIILLCSMPAMAVDKTTVPKLKLRTGEHARYDRVVFDAPAGFSYTYKRNKASVSITFSKAAKLTLRRNYLKRARGFKITKGNDGKVPLTVTFLTDPKAAVTHFKNDNSVVVDIKGAKLSDKAFKALSQPIQAPKRVVEKAAPKASKEKKVDTKRVIKPEVAPPKEKEKKKVLLETSPKPKEKLEKKKAVNTQRKAIPVKVKGPVAPTPKAAPVKKVRTTVAPKMKQAWPPRVRNPMKKKDAIKIQKIAFEKKSKPVVVFDPQVPVGAAVFVRAGYVTILFDRKLSKASLPGIKNARVPLLPFTAGNSTGYRIRVPGHIGVRASRKGTAWQIYLVPGSSKPLLTTEFITQPDFALGARLVVPSSNPPKPVQITDPVVGDELLVIPFQEAGAFTVKRRLSDFQIIPSVQGLVIKPWHERVTARKVSDGIEISSEGGLMLSSPEDMGTLQSTIRKPEGLEKSLFDFKRWMGSEEKRFSQKTQKLWQTIINVEEEERILARLDLARLYFAHGLGYEALSILEVIYKDLPDIEQHADFISLRGAARILVGRVKEGVADLSSPVIKPQPDIQLWRAVGQALLQDWKPAVSMFRTTMPLLATYPEPMRSRFWVLAIESAVASGDTRDVVKWLATIEKEGHSPSVKPAIWYLRGVLHSQAGRVDLAAKLWEKVKDGGDRLYKIRAELALVDLGVATGSLSPEQATERLEGLRYAWRGDGLELDVLKRLGVFYINGKRYRDGFNTLFKVLKLFPDAPQSRQLQANMVKTFQDLFLTDLGDDLSPLEGLSLYTDFQNLIPKGEDGNAVRSNLAERLVNIDLLDQAVMLLRDLYDHSKTSKERIETALRIAGVRLLDHQADVALTVLTEVKDEAFALSTAAANEWRLLHARALSDQGKYQEALAALPQGGEKSSLLLRADMALKARKWTDATAALMELVGPPPKAGGKLSDEQASWLVHTAMAHARNMDTIGLDRLAIDYGSAMDKTKKANVFRVLTRPDETTQLKDIRAAQSNLSEVDMFQGVLDSYRKGRKN